MSRVHRRTFPTRAGLGGTEARMSQRLDLRATGVGALHEANPPGSKLVRRIRQAYLNGQLSVRQRILACRNRKGMRMKDYWRLTPSPR